MKVQEFAKKTANQIRQRGWGSHLLEHDDGRVCILGACSAAYSGDPEEPGYPQMGTWRHNPEGDPDVTFIPSDPEYDKLVDELAVEVQKKTKYKPQFPWEDGGEYLQTWNDHYKRGRTPILKVLDAIAAGDGESP